MRFRPFKEVLFLRKEPEMDFVQQQADPRTEQVQQLVTDLVRQGADWVTFYREVLGVEGIVRRLYATPEQLAAFEQTEECARIQQMLAKLRETKGRGPAPEDEEPTRVITVRLPKSLHEALRDEAHQRKTSMNKLCISKLLQIVDGDLIPAV
jgi:hypothetical protein